MSITEVRAEPVRATELDREPEGGRRAQQLLTALIVFAPLAVTVGVVIGLWGRAVGLRDLMLALVLYAIAGHGVTVGFHRLLTHRAFRASRPLKITLAVAGSLAFEGPVIGWVADHRRHHAFADRPGDPHSPHEHGAGALARVRGLWHAHTGWLFKHDPTSQQHYARDLLGDRDLVVINRLFPLWCVLSLAIPFGLGWLLGGAVGAGLSALLWAGAVRICVLHHITWSINSLCHVYGRRPYATRDRSTNVRAMAIVSMGESWHNNHHAFPSSARHGIDPRQHDSSAALIEWFARRGWARGLREPAADRRAVVHE
jgi:stearoyl-CoA desaturase (Delta-9 desaturase)